MTAWRFSPDPNKREIYSFILIIHSTFCHQSDIILSDEKYINFMVSVVFWYNPVRRNRTTSEKQNALYVGDK